MCFSICGRRQIFIFISTKVEIKRTRSHIVAAVLKMRAPRSGPSTSLFIINQFLLQINANNKAGTHAVAIFSRNTAAVID